MHGEMACQATHSKVLARRTLEHEQFAHCVVNNLSQHRRINEQIDEEELVLTTTAEMVISPTAEMDETEMVISSTIVELVLTPTTQMVTFLLLRKLDEHYMVLQGHDRGGIELGTREFSLGATRLRRLQANLMEFYLVKELFLNRKLLTTAVVLFGSIVRLAVEKTTQLPQYILETEIESGRGAMCSIICTQPRRISAMSVSERVAAERGEPLGESGFTHPVRTHYLENILENIGYSLTQFNQLDDYGQDKAWKMQKQSLRKRKSQLSALVEDALASANFDKHSSTTRDSLACWNSDCIGFNLIEAVLCHICRNERSGAILVFMTGWDDINSLKNQLKVHPLLGDPTRVLLLACHGSMASLEQRRGRAGRVQPGECYHLYPRCVYEALEEYQLPELLRTPLQSLCLQIKSLQLGSIVEFLSRALQPPEPLSVQNAVEYLKTIGALDDKENLTNLGRHLSVLPMEPKLGKMLIMGALFHCLDPILTIAAGLSVRDPFLLPHDRKDLADAAKAKFSANSDHMALVHAYEGWKDARRDGSVYDYCWTNFLSTQTLQAIQSLRRQFHFLLKEAGLLEDDADICNQLSDNQSLVEAVICSGLFPGVVSVVNRKRCTLMKTMLDGQVLLYANSVNAQKQNIFCPWMVFFEKVKVNSVFIRDSTGISDSALLLFGGALTRGEVDGHLKMLDGYLEFFMEPDLAEIYLKLKDELDYLIQKKLQNPSMDIHKAGDHLLLAVQELLLADRCEGRFVFGREVQKSQIQKSQVKKSKDGIVDPHSSSQNPKSLLQTLVSKAGYGQPHYKTIHSNNNQFRGMVEFNGMQFVGKPCNRKRSAEQDAAMEALAWLTGASRPAPASKSNDAVLKKPKKREREL
ncbi:hypothetical protein KI387_017391, partial [Taxus chinensis]